MASSEITVKLAPEQLKEIKEKALKALKALEHLAGKLEKARMALSMLADKDNYDADFGNVWLHDDDMTVWEFARLLRPRLPDPQAGAGSIWQCPECGRKWEVVADDTYYSWREYTGTVRLQEGKSDDQ
jgi:hypothetical protein